MFTIAFAPSNQYSEYLVTSAMAVGIHTTTAYTAAQPTSMKSSQHAGQLQATYLGKFRFVDPPFVVVARTCKSYRQFSLTPGT